MVEIESRSPRRRRGAGHFRDIGRAWLSVAVIVLVDGVGLPRVHSRPRAGVLDEAAHLATGAIVLLAGRRRDPDHDAGALAASFLLDVDHVPEEFGLDWLRRRRSARPVTHSLATVAALTAAAPSRFASGVRVGLL